MSDHEEPVLRLSMSPTIGAIAAAIAKAQMEMGPAIKDAQNPHFRSSYATLASCLEACKPLHKHGVAVLQPPQPAGLDGVCVVTLLAHSSGEWIRGDLWMPAAKRDAQGFGSALSYARRYCLSSTVGLGTDDDDGNEAVKRTPGPAKPAAVPPPAKAQAKDGELFSLLCDKVDRAEAASQLNLIASDAMRAFKAGGITEVQVERLKLALTKKKGLLAAPAREPGDDREEDVAS